jgi:catechol 2,3-dioxygenase-like lactoylglutathione lyase family enzyme
MNDKLVRVGTIYIPVRDVIESTKWYTSKLDAEQSYLDPKHQMAIINMANQSFFLVKVNEGVSSNFIDTDGEERFSITFEVNGLKDLEELHNELTELDVKVGEIEDRGHPGRNFVFFDLDGNKFDVWSELSPIFKKNFGIS